MLLRRFPWFLDVLGRAPDAEVTWVKIQEADLSRLHIIPSNDWYLDTGRTFLLSNLPSNLRPGRIVDNGDGLGPQSLRHRERIDALQAHLANYDADATEPPLILIASSEAGPYTIVDGNNRAGALYLMRDSSLPWRGMLIVGSGIANSRWHATSPEARWYMEQVMEEQVRRGQLR